MDKNFYITTPIYYPSATPHMGHAYSSIIADFFSRFKTIDGYKVYFLTGTDEHGLKIQRSAEKKGLDPLKFCDQISKTFRDLSKILNLTNTDFMSSEYFYIKPNDTIIVNQNKPRVTNSGYVTGLTTVLAIATVALSSIIILSR